MASSLHLNHPAQNPFAQKYSQELSNLIQQKINDSGGWIDFATFMHMALYTPGLGYYSGGNIKFAHAVKGGGDFITAPQISPLFSHTLARQAAQILLNNEACNILELGAGTGKLAADLLFELERLKQLPAQYFILEVSDYLRQIQFETLKKQLSSNLFERVVWLDTLPKDFVGLIFGNEVLDAIPVHLIYQSEQQLFERGVTFEQTFVWQDRALTRLDLINQMSAQVLPDDYLTEICPAANGLIASLAQSLKQGVILMLDYGFGAAEYYHPQRDTGTLMCHYQHLAHSDPLVNIGLQDVTAHVNFTAIAETALANGLSLAGYCNQASFLMNCGILEILGETSPNDIAAYMPLATAAQKLLSPAEMGELFKVIAFSKGLSNQLMGFKSGDKAHML